MSGNDLGGNMDELKMVDLRKMAEAATPGPWTLDVHDTGYSRLIDIVRHEVYRTKGHYVARIQTSIDDTLADGNALFIAAANPKTVLEMLDEIAQLKALLSDCQSVRDATFRQLVEANTKVS